MIRYNIFRYLYFNFIYNLFFKQLTINYYFHYNILLHSVIGTWYNYLLGVEYTCNHSYIYISGHFFTSTPSICTVYGFWCNSIKK